MEEAPSTDLKPRRPEREHGAGRREGHVTGSLTLPPPLPRATATLNGQSLKTRALWGNRERPGQVLTSVWQEARPPVLLPSPREPVHEGQ